MISGIDLNATWDFTIPKDKTNPTVWKLGILPTTITGVLVDKTGTNFFETMIWVVRLALRGWDNFKINDKDVEYRTAKDSFFGQQVEMVVKELIDAIPIPAITALAKEIQEKSQISQAEQKN